jgi:hypothetical protein
MVCRAQLEEGSRATITFGFAGEGMHGAQRLAKALDARQYSPRQVEPACVPN